MCINKMIYYIEEILTQVIQCVKILLVYHLFLSGNLKKKNWKYISGSICLVLIAGIIMYFTENIDALAGRILGMAVCLLLISDNWKGAVTGIFFSLIMVNTTDVLFGLIEDQIFISYNIAHVIIKETINILLYLLTGMLIRKIRVRNNFIFEKVSKIDIAVLVIIFWCCVFVAGGSRGLSVGELQDSKNSIVIATMMEVTGMVLVFIALMQIVVSKERDDYKELIQQKEKYFQINMDYYEAQKNFNREMLAFRHDESKHMQRILDYCRQNDTEGAIRYIKEIRTEVIDPIYLYDCGNETASAIINVYRKKAEDAEISFECRGHMPEYTGILDIDLCIVLSNLLENALEACIKVKGQRFIYVEMRYEEDEMYLQIKNSVNECGNKHNWELKTQKGEGHGIGMKNVNRVVNKYKGNITWDIENAIFVIQMTL